MDRSRSTRAWIARKLTRKHAEDMHDPPVILRGVTEMARLGGVSLLPLPPAFAAAKPAIPTRLAATAAYLLEYGRNTPGIFRIPGQKRTIIALYNHFASQLLSTSNAQDHIDLTIRTASLPQHIIFNTHDIASVFKRFLSDVCGGILGSVTLFQALHSACSSPPPGLGAAEQTTKATVDLLKRSRLESQAHQIAFLLYKLENPHRLALISAVFGLLAYLRYDPGDETDNGTERDDCGGEGMSSHALGVVFAPLLLGDLTDSLESPKKITDTKGRLSRPFSPDEFHGKATSPVKDTGSLASSVEKTMRTGSVTEVLIANWENIVKHFRRLAGPGECYLPWPSAPNPDRTATHALNHSTSSYVQLDQLKEWKSPPMSPKLQPQSIDLRKTPAKAPVSPTKSDVLRTPRSAVSQRSLIPKPVNSFGRARQAHASEPHQTNSSVSESPTKPQRTGSAAKKPEKTRRPSWFNLRSQSQPALVKTKPRPNPEAPPSPPKKATNTSDKENVSPPETTTSDSEDLVKTRSRTAFQSLHLHFEQQAQDAKFSGQLSPITYSVALAPNRYYAHNPLQLNQNILRAQYHAAGGSVPSLRPRKSRNTHNKNVPPHYVPQRQLRNTSRSFNLAPLKNPFLDPESSARRYVRHLSFETQSSIRRASSASAMHALTFSPDSSLSSDPSSTRHPVTFHHQPPTYCPSGRGASYPSSALTTDPSSRNISASTSGGITISSLDPTSLPSSTGTFSGSTAAERSTTISNSFYTGHSGQTYLPPQGRVSALVAELQRMQRELDRSRERERKKDREIKVMRRTHDTAARRDVWGGLSEGRGR